MEQDQHKYGIPGKFRARHRELDRRVRDVGPPLYPMGSRRSPIPDRRSSPSKDPGWPEAAMGQDPYPLGFQGPRDDLDPALADQGGEGDEVISALNRLEPFYRYSSTTGTIRRYEGSREAWDLLREFCNRHRHCGHPQACPTCGWYPALLAKHSDSCPADGRNPRPVTRGVVGLWPLLSKTLRSAAKKLRELTDNSDDWGDLDIAATRIDYFFGSGNPEPNSDVKYCEVCDWGWCETVGGSIPCSGPKPELRRAVALLARSKEAGPDVDAQALGWPLTGRLHR